MGIKWKKLLIYYIVIIGLITGCQSTKEVVQAGGESFSNFGEELIGAELTNENISVQAPIEIEIMAVGDIMVHSPQLKAQYDIETKEYDFTNNFQFIKPYIQKADIALGNLETTFAGRERGYAGYPLFNAPDALAYALKEAGFDIISTANNHTLDMGKQGVFRTIEVLQESGLSVIGTKKQEQDESFLVVDVKGMKVGFGAYTYETPRFGKNKTLNGIRIPQELEPLIDSFSYELLEEDLSKIEERIVEMKEQGAELIVLYVHWGDEYKRNPNSYQRKIAQALADYGVDIILGSHPHVLQPIEWISSQREEKETLVVYSLGNFLSNQRFEYMNNRFTEDGMILSVKVIKDFDTNSIDIKEVTYIPTWVHKYYGKNKYVYEIIPLLDALLEKEKYQLHNGNSVWRAENSKNNTRMLIEGEDATITPALPLVFQEPPIADLK